MLFYIEYGCSVSHERLIIEADNFDKADEYAERAAQDVYYSYDCNYLSDEDYGYFEDEGMTEEEISEQEYSDMLNDIYWIVEPYDPKNEDHLEAMKEQDEIPYEV